MPTEDLLKLKKELEYKFSEFNNIQKTKKVQLNSCYGAIGNKHFRWYDVRLAESVTYTGKFVIKWVDREINKHFNKVFKTDEDYVIFAHTDSMYIRLDRVVDKLFGDKQYTMDTHDIINALIEFCNSKIYPKIKTIFALLAEYLNAFENKMHMKMEIIADKGVWDGKNRYILSVYYKEGSILEFPKLKFVGIETVKSSIPMICRTRLSQALEILMWQDVQTLREFVYNFRNEYEGLPILDIAFPIGVKNLEAHDPQKTNTTSQDNIIYMARKGKVKNNTGKESVVGCPRNVKASLIHNYFIKKFKLHKKYKLITNNNKIKFVILNDMNPISVKLNSSSIIDTIGFKDDVIPEEFCLVDKNGISCINRNEMFDKSFMKPLSKIMKAVGWTMHETVSFDSINEGL